LKEADKATGLLEVSIDGLVFMLATALLPSGAKISVGEYPVRF